MSIYIRRVSLNGEYLTPHINRVSVWKSKCYLELEFVLSLPVRESLSSCIRTSLTLLLLEVNRCNCNDFFLLQAANQRIEWKLCRHRILKKKTLQITHLLFSEILSVRMARSGLFIVLYYIIKWFVGRWSQFEVFWLCPSFIYIYIYVAISFCFFF